MVRLKQQRKTNSRILQKLNGCFSLWQVYGIERPALAQNRSNIVQMVDGKVLFLSDGGCRCLRLRSRELTAIGRVEHGLVPSWMT